MKNIAKWLNLMFIPGKKNLWKPHVLRSKNLFYLAVILLAIKFIIFSIVFYFPQTTNFAVVTSSELVKMANSAREAAGLKPLAVNDKLVQAAQKKALDMLNKSYFAHNSPSGLTPWYWLDKVGYRYVAAGENLAKDFTESEYVHNAWMKSASHKKNILNKNYSDVGIAVVEGQINGKKTILAVQFFGKSSQVKTTIKDKPVAVSDVDIEMPVAPNIMGEEFSLKGPQVFKEIGVVSSFNQESKSIIETLSQKSEPIAQKVYLIILGIISLVLMLTIFINIKVQYPRMILMVLIFIVLIAAITNFNGSEILNKGIDII